MGGDLINGEVPSHWEFTTLGDVCRRGGGSIQTGPFGSQLHASDYVPVGVPSIMPTNIGDNRIIEDGIVRVTEADANRLGQHRVRPGDIIYSRRGDVEKRALIRERESGWLCGTGCLKVRLGNGVVDPVYASFFLGHPSIREWIVRHAIGATMPNLNTSIMSDVLFALPPMDEQRAIANILGTLDDKIEMNRQTNETLEAMARALFKSWFVDFDPVHAKAEGRQPTGMDAETTRLFPSGFEESELGEIPKGWTCKPLADAAELNPTRFLKKDVDAPYVEMASLPTRGHRPTEWPLRKTRSGARFQNGDTLLARITPCLENGKTGYVDFLDDGFIGWGSTEYIVIRPRPPLPAEWGYLLARDETFRDYAAQKMEGTTGRQRVSADSAGRYPVVVPSADVAERFGLLVTALFKRMASAHDENRVLEATRDALLPRLLSGELSVSSAKRVMEVEA